VLVFVVADYGAGDLAFAEVTQRIVAALPDAQVMPIPVGPFDTVSAGFCVAQLALNPGPPARIVFHNVAPRQDADDVRPGNEGERLAAARLPDGTLVVGVNAGSAFSFLAGDADVREVEAAAAGSQFRSRDVFPDALADLVMGRAELGQPLAANAVPELPERSVVYIDAYGNLKTSWATAPVDSGTRVNIEIAGTTAEAVASDGTFEVPAGALSFAPGSSGWPSRPTFYEVFLRGGSAAERFGGVRAGDPVTVVPA